MDNQTVNEIKNQKIVVQTRPETISKLTKMAEERRTKFELTPEETQIMDLERKLYRLVIAERDIDTGLSYLADDAIVGPPGIDFIKGRENQIEMFKGLLSLEGVEFAWEPVDAFVSPSKDMAYATGVVQWKMPDENELFGKYISIWVKENEQWVNKVEMRNTIVMEDMQKRES